MNAKPPDASAHRRDKSLVLLVEDDVLGLKLMKDVLEARGYAVSQATSGPEGVCAAHEHRPDMVVMDIGLPGIEGAEVTRMLKHDPATMAIPVLAVSAYAMPADEERMRDAGCDAFLTKPLRLAEFMQTVERLLAASASVAKDEAG